jgi:regulator of sigma E protease
LALSIITFVAVLGLLVFVHELGHFLVAKRAGIVVEEFAFGYPPRLFKFWQDEGEITIDSGAGAQKLVIPRQVNLPQELTVNSPVAFASKVDDGGRPVLAELRLLPPKLDKGKDDWCEDEEEAPPPIPAGLREGLVVGLARGTEYTVNAMPFGGFARMLGEEDPRLPGSFASKGKLTRVAVLCAGSGMNFLLAILVAALSFMLGAPYPVAYDNTVVTGVAPNSPAAEAGLQLGDVVLKINDHEVTSPEDMAAYTRSVLGQEVVLEVKRGTQVLHFSLVPRPNPPQNEGPMGVALSAAVSKIEIRYYPLHEALLYGVEAVMRFVKVMVGLPAALIGGLLQLKDLRPVGPAGIYQMTDSAVHQSVATGWWWPILYLTYVLSTALAFTNLLPLPALDGGRLLFIAIETVRGRRVEPQREGLVHLIGFLALITLLIVISYYDIVSPPPDIDWTSLF